MLKKILLNIAFMLSVIILGEIIYLFTGSSFIANWGSIIIPSLLMGIIWENIYRGSSKKPIRYIVPILLVLIKVLAFLISVQEPTALAIAMIAVLYGAVSYVMFRMGVRIAASQMKEQSQK